MAGAEPGCNGVLVYTGHTFCLFNDPELLSVLINTLRFGLLLKESMSGMRVKIEKPLFVCSTDQFYCPSEL